MIALSEISSAVHDIELRLLKRRRYFIFNDFDSRPVSYDLIAGFNAFDPAHIHTHRRVELQQRGPPVVTSGLPNMIPTFSLS